MKKIFSIIGSGFVLIVVVLAIFAPTLCIEFLIWCAGRLQAIGVALAAAAEEADRNNALGAR